MLAALFAKRKVWTSPFGRCFTVAERACRNGSECGPAFRQPRAYRALTARCLQSRNRHTPGRRGLRIGLPMAPRGRATACAQPEHPTLAGRFGGRVGPQGASCVSGLLRMALAGLVGGPRGDSPTGVLSRLARGERDRNAWPLRYSARDRARRTQPDTHQAPRALSPRGSGADDRYLDARRLE
jgi:hypothetical protein